MFYEVLFLGHYACQPFASPPLGPVKAYRIPLDISFMTYGNNHIFVSYQVLNANLPDFLKYLCPSIVPVSCADILHLVPYKLGYHGRTFNDSLVSGYILNEVFVFRAIFLLAS